MTTDHRLPPARLTMLVAFVVLAACTAEDHTPSTAQFRTLDSFPEGEPIELQSQPIPASFFDHQDDTTMAWLGMAGLLVNARGTILLIDPLISLAESDGERKCEGHYRLRTPLPIEFEELPKVDAVLYTHADGDHFGRMTAEAFGRRTECRFIAPSPVGRLLEEMGIESSRITTARDLDKIEVGKAVVEVTPALHDWQEEDPWQRGDCAGYVIRSEDGSVWHPGDTRLIDELLEVQDIDVLLFDVAAVNAHLGPKGSAQLARSTGAPALVAYHYGTFVLPPGSYGNCDPRDAAPYLEGLRARYFILDPGEPLRLPLR